ncbi:MAG: FixH family protein [Gammaproteobacteria bacterium]|nr:FixH family protein [Gammaproteobacteria bacterium]MBT8133442.1 FixH family protein [Gammaproteobacteria bacterium]NNJ51155.1 FixH family protein [Gammaproteobacteria bacterium]
MQSSELKKPWHSYPLVWMMISIPFSAVIMGVIMISLAINTDDGLVADDYYKQGLAINDVITLDKKATELNLSAVIQFESDSKVINVRFDKGLIDDFPASLLLNFHHATRANSDISITLNHGMGDQYIGYLDEPISQGVWYFEVTNTEMAEENWKLNARSYVTADNVIKLQSDL